MISMSKQYRTRDGRDVRILCTDAGGNNPVVALVPVNHEKNAPFGVVRYFLDGCLGPFHNNGDLIEVRPKFRQEMWVNIYRTAIPCAWPTRKQADCGASLQRIACVKVVVEGEEGEGL